MEPRRHSCGVRAPELWVAVGPLSRVSEQASPSFRWGCCLTEPSWWVEDTHFFAPTSDVSEFYMCMGGGTFLVLTQYLDLVFTNERWKSKAPQAGVSAGVSSVRDLMLTSKIPVRVQQGERKVMSAADFRLNSKGQDCGPTRRLLEGILGSSQIHSSLLENLKSTEF